MNNPMLNGINQQQSKNPALQQVFNSLKTGANPRELLRSVAGNNPMLASLLNNNNMSMQQMAEQLCQQKGIDINQALSQVQNQFGIK